MSEHLDTAGRDTYTYTYVVCTVGAHTFESTTINVCSLQILTSLLMGHRWDNGGERHYHCSNILHRRRLALLVAFSAFGAFGRLGWRLFLRFFLGFSPSSCSSSSSCLLLLDLQDTGLEPVATCRC